jgi:hypothetical protein
MFPDDTRLLELANDNAALRQRVENLTNGIKNRQNRIERQNLHIRKLEAALHLRRFQINELRARKFPQTAVGG